MGLLDSQVMDPKTAALLSAAFAGLQASGPSRMPTSLGQVIGTGGAAGMGAYNQAVQAKILDDYRRAQQAHMQSQDALLRQQEEREKRKLEFGLGLLSGQPGQPASMRPASMAAGPVAPGMGGSGSGVLLGGGGPGLTTRQDMFTPQQVLGASLMGFPGDLMLKLNERENPALQFHGGFGVDPRTGEIRSSIPQTNQQGFSTQTVPDGMGGFRVQVTPGSAEAYRTQQGINYEFGAPQTVQEPVPGKPGEFRNFTGTPMQIKGRLEGGGAVGPTTAEAAEAEARRKYKVEQATDYAALAKNLNTATFTNPAKIAKYEQIGQLLGDFEGGKLSGGSFELARIANSAGVKIDPKLPNKEAAEALSREAALELKNSPMGNLMPGSFSNADRDYVASITPQMAQTAAGRKSIIDARVKLWRREMEVAQFARNYQQKYGRLDDNFLSQLQAWSNDHPIFK